MAIPRGIRNNNPLNIRRGNNWRGERPHQSDPAFEEFVSMEYGLRAAFIILRNYITGRGGRTVKFNTIDKIIRRWAPAVENATEKYVQFVERDSGINRFAQIDFKNRKAMVDIVYAMCQVENGTRVDRSLIESSYDLV